MDDRSRQDEARLQVALEEGWGVEDPRLAELLERRPEWRGLLVAGGGAELSSDELERFRSDTTEEDRRQTHEFLALARAGEGRREGSLEGASSGDGPSVPSTRAPRALRVLLPLAAAFALLTTAALWWFLQQERPAESDVQPLGSGTPEAWSGAALTCVGPVGEVAGYGDFRWRASDRLKAGETFEVVVRSVAGEARELARVRVRGTSWSPASAASASWPDRIVWSVQRVDGSGFPGPSAEASAQRSR